MTGSSSGGHGHSILVQPSYIILEDIVAVRPVPFLAASAIGYRNVTLWPASALGMRGRAFGSGDEYRTHLSH